MNNFLNPKVKEIFKTTGKHYFFGYYDKCPWSKDGRYLLAHEVDFIDHLPNGNEPARIGIIDLQGDKKFKTLTETYAWNFQQGSMLQWLGPDFNERIIFNDLRRGKFVSVILNIKTEKEEKEIPFPVYAVHPSGESALSVDFSLLDEVREGYGYKGISNNEDSLIYSFNLNKPYDKKYRIYDGEFHKESINFKDPNSKHWADHLAFNLSGSYFAFLHRQSLKGGGFSSQLYSVHTDGKIILVGPGILLDSGMASHFVWKNDEQILVWGRPPGISARVTKSSLRKLIAPIYHVLFRSANLRQKFSGDSFLLFKTLSRNFEKIGAGKLIEDGHATFSPDKNWLLTDTYASKNKKQKFLLFNLSSKELIELGSFNSMPDKKFGVKNDWDSSNLRCDLHPRFSRDGTQICIDSVHEGTRQVYILDVSKIVNYGEN